jgi:hypothetical protein
VSDGDFRQVCAARAAFGIRHQLELQGVRTVDLDTEAIARAALAWTVNAGYLIPRPELVRALTDEREKAARWRSSWASVSNQYDSFRTRVQSTLAGHPDLAAACGVVPLVERAES